MADRTLAGANSQQYNQASFKCVYIYCYGCGNLHYTIKVLRLVIPVSLRAVRFPHRCLEGISVFTGLRHFEIAVFLFSIIILDQSRPQQPNRHHQHRPQTTTTKRHHLRLFTSTTPPRKHRFTPILKRHPLTTKSPPPTSFPNHHSKPPPPSPFSLHYHQQRYPVNMASPSSHRQRRSRSV